MLPLGHRSHPGDPVKKAKIFGNGGSLIVHPRAAFLAVSGVRDRERQGRIDRDRHPGQNLGRRGVLEVILPEGVTAAEAAPLHIHDYLVGIFFRSVPADESRPANAFMVKSTFLGLEKS